MDAALKNYVNRELNRMLTQEKPKTIYMAKLPRNPGIHTGGQRDVQKLTKVTGDTHFLRMWKKGFVTERLQWKCEKDGVVL